MNKNRPHKGEKKKDEGNNRTMKKKKVSRLLVDEKVPLHEKEDVRILECSKRIAWVSGMRIDERFKVKSNTQKVLVVKRVAK